MPAPILCLAPMDDVTDVAFRTIIARYSKPHTPHYVTWSEFTSADGLVLADARGQEKLRAKLRYSSIERPVVAQIFSAVPEHMERAAALCAELGFDGIDINMGCPDRSVEKQGAGAALIKNPALATELIAATQQGAGDVPVSVKTRIGYARDELDTWVGALLRADIAALSIHARTRNELSKVPAQWDAIKRAVVLCDEMGVATRIIGNGDVTTVTEARENVRTYGCDGVMIGRGMFGNPWVMSNYTPTLAEKLQALVEHTELFEAEFSDIKSFAVMRKHFASYVEGFAGAKELRTTLMSCDSARDVADTIEVFLVQNAPREV